MASLAIKNFTRHTTAQSEIFEKIAKVVLPHFDISLAFVGSARARTLNRQLRNKKYVPNVLSYALDENNGEIIICLPEAVKQAPLYKMSRDNFVLYLFIHGLLHIKGWAHGATMEECERKLLAKYATSDASFLSNVTTHSNRNRYRHVPSKDGRSRRTR